MLYGLMAAAPLSIKAGKELDPCGAAFVAGAGPSFPRSLLYKAMYIFGYTVGEGVEERAVKVVGHRNSTKVLQLIFVIVDGASDDHLSAGVVTVYRDVGLPPCFPLQFFSHVYSDDDLVDVGKPVSIKDLAAE